MNRFVILGFTVFGLVSTCVGDFRPCTFTGTKFTVKFEDSRNKLHEINETLSSRRVNF